MHNRVLPTPEREGPTMRFASVLLPDRAPAAVAIEDQLAIPLAGITELGSKTPSSLLSDPPLRPDAAIPMTEVTLRPVIPRPGKVICVGLNYHAHVEETHRELPEYPVLFTKFATSLTGPADPITCPPESEAIDYEGELAVVIGERARRIAPATALSVVAGYTVANDVTMRDYQYKTHQWLQGKAWDASTPLGPALVTSDEIADPGALMLRTFVNGEQVQSASTELLIFDVATLVSVISGFATLEPGDVILTGTPGGVGFRREPQLLLGDGDVVAVEIDRVGRIENRFVREPD
jgi:acylpyruvate hydrolase